MGMTHTNAISEFGCVVKDAFLCNDQRHNSQRQLPNFRSERITINSISVLCIDVIRSCLSLFHLQTHRLNWAQFLLVSNHFSRWYDAARAKVIRWQKREATHDKAMHRTDVGNKLFENIVINGPNENLFAVHSADVVQSIALPSTVGARSTEIGVPRSYVLSFLSTLCLRRESWKWKTTKSQIEINIHSGRHFFCCCCCCLACLFCVCDSFLPRRRSEWSQRSGRAHATCRQGEMRDEEQPTNKNAPLFSIYCGRSGSWAPVAGPLAVALAFALFLSI